MTRTAENIVRQDVHYCVSALVHTLAQHDGASLDLSASDDLAQLTEQAFELSTPINDWEEAAREAGWEKNGDVWTHAEFPMAETSAENACYAANIEPHEREVFEHWVISDWLADKLAEKGEKVDKDFAGLTVWARTTTTTGQAISMDAVIEEIAADLNRPIEERLDELDANGAGWLPNAS